MALAVERVPVLTDNYAWLLHDADSGTTAVVDPGEAAPVLAAVAARGWKLGEIWITHWHPDHTGGIAGLRAAVPGLRVTAPRSEMAKIPGAETYVEGGDRVMLGAHTADIIETPGHTLGHIVFHLAEDAMLFTGDTLFAMGCGRLLEGTPAQMFASLARFGDLPDSTQVYAGHEYTLANGRFAHAAEPDNAAIADRLASVEQLRAEGKATLPTTLEAERATNPFVRALDIDALAKLRQAKDNFPG